MKALVACCTERPSCDHLSLLFWMLLTSLSRQFPRGYIGGPNRNCCLSCCSPVSTCLEWVLCKSMSSYSKVASRSKSRNLSNVLSWQWRWWSSLSQKNPFTCEIHTRNGLYQYGSWISQRASTTADILTIGWILTCTVHTSIANICRNCNHLHSPSVCTHMPEEP